MTISLNTPGLRKPDSVKISEKMLSLLSNQGKLYSRQLLFRNDNLFLWLRQDLLDLIKEQFCVLFSSADLEVDLRLPLLLGLKFLLSAQTHFLCLLRRLVLAHFSNLHEGDLVNGRLCQMFGQCLSLFSVWTKTTLRSVELEVSVGSPDIHFLPVWWWMDNRSKRFRELRQLLESLEFLSFRNLEI
jgi:hypothetical protein